MRGAFRRDRIRGTIERGGERKEMGNPFEGDRERKE